MTFFAPPPSCRWSLALELGHYPRLVELRGQSSRASTGCSALGQPAATQGNDWPCSHRGRWRQARDHQPIHRVTLRFETIAGPGEPQRPFRRQRVIARHSTKPTWTQSLLRLGWCRERVRVPQEVAQSRSHAGASSRRCHKGCCIFGPTAPHRDSVKPAWPLRHSPHHDAGVLPSIGEAIKVAGCFASAALLTFTGQSCRWRRFDSTRPSPTRWRRVRRIVSGAAAVRTSRAACPFKPAGHSYH